MNQRAKLLQPRQNLEFGSLDKAFVDILINGSDLKSGQFSINQFQASIDRSQTSQTEKSQNR